VLIEAKTMRMRGHAQHDPAAYVPKEMLEYWKARDPIARHEKFLVAEKLLDAKSKREIEGRIEALIEKDRQFAEESPLPPAEIAAQGVYCEGCHTIQAKWERPVEEVMPPKSSVVPEWRAAPNATKRGAEKRAAVRNPAAKKPAKKARGSSWRR